MAQTELQASDAQPLADWWQSRRLTEQGCWHIAIGPFSLYLERTAGEWLVSHQRHSDDEPLHRVLQEPIEACPESLTVQRYVFQKAPLDFRLQPCLMDRPVVVKTRQPVLIPPGESIDFYISTPLCLRLLLGNDTLLQEWPILRLSDTWFGPSTRVGELCYAAKTHARHSLDEVPLRPHRAVTPLTISNQSKAILSIDKVSLPVPLLSVFARSDHTLWTEAVTLVHQADQLLAKLKIERKLPVGITAAQRVTEPRQQAEKNALVRAFAGIFSD
ncbi:MULTISPECIES: hypothetical protein [Alkalimonas]|uniref:DUF432 domain-containing protein n=2 Tax=Alkalimonas TaxID=265980 RepID=A0A1H3YFX1_ALKAM|nr:MULTISPECIES: hypothetical protein [Alkalimonas]MEE2023873.1 hypothetical protein [Alkalimonas sp. MEB004]SEA09818.1 hypothetical protein SAMN04488051_101649 [Alkalimonas amylolytica]